MRWLIRLAAFAARQLGQHALCYDSPEDELGGNLAPRYRSFLERQEKGK